MSQVLWLLVAQGTLGAFDTLYFHEYRARLVVLPGAAPELRLHAARDAIYAVLFFALPRCAWQGAWTLVLLALLAAEILITLTDFVVEDRVRKALGGVFAGERVTHALMAILYGALLGQLVPELLTWWSLPSGLFERAPAPLLTPWMTLMAVGVLGSGARDLLCASGVPATWPWRRQ